MDLIKLIDQNVECVATQNGRYLKRSEVFDVVERFTSTNKPIVSCDRNECPAWDCGVCSSYLGPKCNLNGTAHIS